MSEQVAMTETPSSTETSKELTPAVQSQVTPSPKSKVTKNPGRIEAGKRLAEWNKQKKLNQQVKETLKFTEQNDEANANSNFNQDVKQINIPNKPSGDFKMMGGVVVIAVGGCYLAYKLYNKYKQKALTVKPEESSVNRESLVKEVQAPNKYVHDPFHM